MRGNFKNYTNSRGMTEKLYVICERHNCFERTKSNDVRLLFPLRLFEVFYLLADIKFIRTETL